jgi:dinuclear metal center YbgI/SA1388 family protein
MVIAHHPIIFSGLKSLTGKNYIERTILKAIKNDIAIYAIHTNLDNYIHGVNEEIGRRIGLKNLEILAPKKGSLIKMVVYCPLSSTEQVKRALFDSGAGNIGNYSECSFKSSGEGTYKGNEESNPSFGEKGIQNQEKEDRIEVLISKHHLNKSISALLDAHPYEEVAYDLIPILNSNKTEGAGMIGELSEPMETKKFLTHLKKSFDLGIIRHTKLVNQQIKTVAYCGGSGSFLLKNALSKKADIYITGDFKYHEFFDAEDKIIIADIGHYESEQYTKNLIHDYLTKKFPKFAVHLTETSTNPINYF